MDTVFLALRVALSLAAVLGLLWLLQKRVAKGQRVRRSTSRLTVVGRHSLGRRASVVLVEAEGQRLLLGVTEHSVSVLQSSVVTPTVELEAAPVSEPRHLEAVRAHAFAEVLDATGTDGASVASVQSDQSEPLQFRPRRNRNQPASPVAGSILSPATWRQTAAALRQAR